MSRRTLFIAVLTAALSALAPFVLPHASRSAEPSARPGPESATNTLPVAEELSTRVEHTANADRYIIPVLESGAVLDAMRAYAARSDFTFTGSEHPGLGFFVESIGGKKSGGDSYWFLYVNGSSSSRGASTEMVSPGDEVEWRYERGY